MTFACHKLSTCLWYQPPTSHRPPPTYHLQPPTHHLPPLISHLPPSTSYRPPPTSHLPPPTFFENPLHTNPTLDLFLRPTPPLIVRTNRQAPTLRMAHTNIILNIHKEIVIVLNDLRNCLYMVYNVTTRTLTHKRDRG